jgi:ABC-type transporter Mla subunit MlaD
MPRQLRWSALRNGIIAVSVVVAIILATMLFARPGALHGKKVTLYVLADDATGVITGTQVWLAGKHSGTVKDVSFRAPTADSSGRLLITAEVLVRDLPHVRRDSWAQVQAGGKLLGTPVVYVSPGSAAFPALREGDTIRIRPKPRALDVAVQVQSAMPAFRELLTEVKTLNSQLSRPTGTIGAYRARGMPAMGDAGARMSRIAGRMTDGDGTIGLAMRGDLKGRASKVMAAADSLMEFASSGEGSIGRFRRDSTLMTTANGIIAELDSLRARAKGFGGADSSLTLALARRRALTDSLIQDIKKRPMRYIHF